MSPLVSVVIPAYNRAGYLPEAIDSALSQTVEDLELIVVDDGSTDPTAEVVRGFGDKRITYVYQTNQGRSAARNRGSAQARGEFLGWLDSDDRYLPDALEAHLQAFSRSPGLGLTIGGHWYVGQDGQHLGERRPWEEGGDLTVPNWLLNSFAMPGSVLVRRDWFERSGGFDSTCEIAEDWDLFLRLAQAGCPMAWVSQPVCFYRQHSGSSIRALALHRDGALRTLDKFFARPDLPAEIAARSRGARAWVHVVFARKAYAAGQAALGARDLTQAVTLDPELAGARRIEALEFLVTPETGGAAGWREHADVVLGHLPREFPVRRGDARRALGRVEMAQFFRAARQQARAEALRHLKAGVRLDPRWLTNRGVLAFWIKQALRKNSELGV